MNNQMQHRSWIPGIGERVAGAALALAIMLVPAVLATGSAQAQTYSYSLLYSFMGSPDGATPLKNLVQDTQGNLYGVTKNGGDAACTGDGPGCGTVFKVDTTGKETLLYSFVATGGDGTNPHASLVRDEQGNLYGTTMVGGGAPCSRKPTCGTVFKLTPPAQAGGPWTETVLFNFSDTAGGGASPEQGLVLDPQGNLYGMTVFGGTSGYGTVFKVASPAQLGGTWTETVLYNFTGTGGAAGPLQV